MQLNIVRCTEDCALEEGGLFVVLPGTKQEALTRMQELCFGDNKEPEDKDAFYVAYSWDTEDGIMRQLLSGADDWTDTTPHRKDLDELGVPYVLRKDLETEPEKETT